MLPVYLNMQQGFPNDILMKLTDMKQSREPAAWLPRRSHRSAPVRPRQLCAAASSPRFQLGWSWSPPSFDFCQFLADLSDLSTAAEPFEKKTLVLRQVSTD